MRTQQLWNSGSTVTKKETLKISGEGLLDQSAENHIGIFRFGFQIYS